MIQANTRQQFSIIIVSYNRTELLKQCIDSVLKYTENFELLIWDNASNEKGREQYLKSLESGNNGIRIFYSKKNIGAGSGRREVSKFAEGKYIIFLDDDMVVTDNWAIDLVELIESEDKIAGVSAIIVNMPENKIMMRGCKFREYEKMASIFPIDSNKPYSKEMVLENGYCDLMGGGGVVFKKKIFDKFLIDINYNRALADYDFSLQINKAGYKFMNSNKSVIYHWRSKDYENFPDYNSERYKLSLIAKNYVYFRKKWGKELAGGVFYEFKGCGISDALIKTLSDYSDYFEDDLIRNYFKGTMELISDYYEQNDNSITSNELNVLINSITKKKDKEYEELETTFYRFASVLKKAGKFEFALNLFEFLEKSNNIQIKSGCLFHQGEMYFIRKDFKKSKKYLNECIKIIPEHKRAADLLKKIKNYVK